MKTGIQVDKITIKSLMEDLNVKIPPFQRKLVWKNIKKEDLIDSLIKSFPIGAVTLFFDKSDGSYLMVDGLQRYNTIRTYFNNPNSIISFRKYYLLIDDELLVFCGKFGFKESLLKKAIKSWYEDLESISDTIAKYRYDDFNHLSEHLKKYYKEEFNDFQKFQELRNILLKNIDLNNQEIALITYNGEIDDLPDIFTKINQKTVSLTPYEILHSVWYDYVLEDGEKQREYLYLFKKMISENQEYENNTENLKFNMYMNLVALGYKIMNNNVEEIKLKIGYFYRNEIFFDIFSTIFMKTTNKINAAVKHVLDVNGKVDSEFVMDLNESMFETAMLLNSFLSSIDYNLESKYFYIYLFYWIVVENYVIDKEGRKISKKNQSLIIPFNKDSIKEMIDNKWFKDENRQLNFFIEKVKKLEIKHD